jgi:peptide/nickel transport system substrate-binding protein
MKKVILWGLVILCFSAFQTEKPKKEVIVWLSASPVYHLFSVRAIDATTINLAPYLFQSLVDFDPESEAITPLLIEKLPESSIAKNGEHHLKFTLRQEAKWDDENPITAEDVAFSLKLLFCCATAAKIVYFDNVKAVEIDANDAKKFTLIFNNFQMTNELNLEILTIYPKAFYDKEGLLDMYSSQEIRTQKNELETLIDFEKNYNEIEKSLGYINGSGAYELKVETKKEIIFTRKKDWWCDKIEIESLLFKAYPKTIIFKIIPDINKAEAVLESGDLDVMTRISPKKFTQDYQKNEAMNQQFHLLTEQQGVYSYIGLNMNHPILNDKKVRQALAYLMDRQTYNDTVFYSLGRFTEHPFSSKVIVKPIAAYDFNLKKAKQLLREAGWEDRNNNGLLDNAVNGELQEFKISIMYPSVATTSEDGCQIFKKNCKKLGIEVVLIAYDYRVFLENLKNKKFDAYFGLWQKPVIESDMMTLFHTSAYGSGQNYCGFQNNQVDELLENSMFEPSFKKRKEAYQQIAEIIKEECPYIFLISVDNRIAVSKRFERPPVTSSLRLGVYIPGLL